MSPQSLHTHTHHSQHKAHTQEIDLWVYGWSAILLTIIDGESCIKTVAVAMTHIFLSLLCSVAQRALILTHANNFSINIHAYFNTVSRTTNKHLLSGFQEWFFFCTFLSPSSRLNWYFDLHILKRQVAIKACLLKLTHWQGECVGEGLFFEGGDVEECILRSVFDFLGIHRPTWRNVWRICVMYIVFIGD